MIKQTLLRDILDRRALVTDLRVAYEQAKAELERVERSVIEGIDHGEPHERGPIAAAIAVESVRRPKWKEAYADRLGAEAVAKVIAHTAPTEHQRLVVVERGTKG